MNNEEQIAPLSLPRYTPVQEFLRGIPFVGASPHVDIAKQLSLRDESYLSAWDRAPLDVDLYVALRVARVIAREVDWPNDYFVPDDPVALLIVDRGDALDSTFVVMEIERELSLPELPEAFWVPAFEGTFGELIADLGRALAPEHGNASSP